MAQVPFGSPREARDLEQMERQCHVSADSLHNMQNEPAPLLSVYLEQAEVFDVAFLVCNYLGQNIFTINSPENRDCSTASAMIVLTAPVPAR